MVQASVIVAGIGHTLFPAQQVILDKTECAATSTESPPGQTGSPYTNDTCSQLNEIASSIHVITCTRKDGCTGLTCSGLGYRTELTLLPCVVPPGFNVEVYRDTDDMLVYTANITSGTTEYIAPHGILISVMVQQSPAGFTVKVLLVLLLFLLLLLFLFPLPTPPLLPPLIPPPFTLTPPFTFTPSPPPPPPPPCLLLLVFPLLLLLDHFSFCLLFARPLIFLSHCQVFKFQVNLV